MPINARQLFDKYKYDFVDQNEYTEKSEQQALRVVNEILTFHGFTLKSFNLPDIKDISTLASDVANDNCDENVLELEREVITLVTSLTKYQRTVFDAVMTAVSGKSRDKLIYLDGPGGSGKSYLHNTIITTLKSRDMIVLPVAWTGIAANLLKRGRTVHSMFKLPLNLTEQSTCNVKPNTQHGIYIRNAKMIIWDEVTMASKYALEAVERLLKDICQCNEPFGGKIIILSGDFRQILPVVRHGSRTHIVEACVKRSGLWNKFRCMSLKANMRVGDKQAEFEQWLLKVGDGITSNSFERNNEAIHIPPDIISDGHIVGEIFGETIDPHDPPNYGKVILAPTNVDVIAINNEITSKTGGIGMEYLCVDSGTDEDNTDISNILPIEFH